ncbi:glutamyl endopeptidase [Actinoplanes sp. SE50]|uniref:trypsin-like serine peptidase n=1 Tax=unclassified Actinoplanes TaxID=2626549 RepID=UPI00023EDF83|nr:MULTISPECIES: serine protease [unclassified Actinoplanes]AEV88885.1 Glutamyl endopeptidase [Actinoplanes sp. SE50/110]ATO87291.1 glutamyl endopeptidase [Actinoplanes sp. SE50]SLM04709.1 glutamyl endopeptidase [Actinoplanes sp. SE50/110]
MRRKTVFVVGACAALVLAGVAGAVTATRGDDHPARVWHSAPGVPKVRVAAEATLRAVPSPTSRAAKKVDEAPVVKAPDDLRHAPIVESAQVPDEPGRQQVGELLSVGRLLGYLAGPPRETFRYPGASYVKLHFARMAMLPGDYVTVSNPAGTESYRYQPGSTGRWAMSITGDTAVVQVHRALDPLGLRSALDGLGVTVDRAARGFSRTEQARVPEETTVRPGRTGREESICGPDTSADAVCYQSADPVAYVKSKAIARLLINGTELCTGWRVGPKNRMLTNNHCLTTSEEAYDTEVWFNYQCAKCGGYDVFKPTKVWGDRVFSTDHVLDYTLFSVDAFETIQQFGYLTLDPARPAKGTELYVPQHPAGEPTRIAGAKGDKAGNCAVEDADYTGYVAHSDVSYLCDTAGGSSGSPVLSRKTNRVVALHHFGGCPNSGVRGDLLAAKLRAYL